MKQARESKISSTSSLYPEFLVKIINKKLQDYLQSYNKLPGILKESISYSIQNGGKRFRPVLCMVTAGSLGGRVDIALPTACAIELIHTYSLIHDDLPSIDNDDYRRGKATCHRVFGEDIAILTGDALFAESFNLILEHQYCKPGKKIELIKEIAKASGAEGMVAGQIVDVFYTGKKITKKILEYMHENKTGKLIIAAVRCGAIIADASGGLLEKLTLYGKNIGLAFQITDDLLDLESSIESAGKTTGKDIILCKNTYPSMYGIEKSRKIAEEKINESINIVKSLDIESEWLVKIAKFLLKRNK